jgi:hypothetical protein
MKRCPNCQRTYPDDAPGFCVNDGTQLVTEEAQPYDPQKTILASAPPPPAAPPPQYNAAPPAPPPPQYNPAPPQQYQSPNDPAGIKPPTAWQPQPPQAQPPAAAPWPPPPPQQQGQWGGGYYPQPGQQQQPYGAPYAPPAGQSKAFTLSSFITGLVSALAFTLLLLMANGAVDFDRDVFTICYYGSAALGVIAVVLGVLALISRKQRSKWMAIVGIILGIPAIIFFLYIAINYGF